MNEPGGAPRELSEHEAAIALKLALKMSASTLRASLARLEAGDGRALSDYPEGTTPDILRYVLDNRTLVDADAYHSGVRNGVDEVAFALGMPFHGARGEHYDIDQIVAHVRGDEPATCPASEIAMYRAQAANMRERDHANPARGVYRMR